MNRKEFEDILSRLQEEKVYNIDHKSEVLDELYNKYNPTLVMSGLNIDERRHYEKSTSVLKVGDYFIGYRGVTKMYSEMSEYRDIGIYLEFFEMTRETVTVYKYEKV